MRNKKIAVYLCMNLLLMTVGCGKSNTDLDVPTVDTIIFNDVINSNVEENNSSYQDDIENEQLQSASELDGIIESIGDNSVVINETFHPSENEAVSYQGSEKVLVTVYFSEETEFEVWTVKNGGVNGDNDIEKRQGTFSDLKQDVDINMTGNYEGNDFHAKHVIIYHFV